MFGVPGVGHSKPALLSPGISLSPVYLISYLCRKLLSRFNLSSWPLTLWVCSRCQPGGESSFFERVAVDCKFWSYQIVFVWISWSFEDLHNVVFYNSLSSLWHWNVDRWSCFYAHCLCNVMLCGSVNWCKIRLSFVGHWILNDICLQILIGLYSSNSQLMHEMFCVQCRMFGPCQ